jgi:hypothetical protein
MNSNDPTEELAKQLRYESSSEARRRILGKACEAMDEMTISASAAGRPCMWRITMNTKTGRLALAAAVILIVLGGITLWPAGDPETGQWWLGLPAAWGQEILTALDAVKGVTCREQDFIASSDGSEVRLGDTWLVHYVSRDSYRNDIYDGDFLREIQWYVPEGDGTLHHSVRFDLGSYFTDTCEGSFGNHDPVERMRLIVAMLDRADKLLGEEVFEGRNCVGFEISASTYGDNPADWIDRIWFDADTKLPVRIEEHGRETSGPLKIAYFTVKDQFDYDPDLPADTFVPATPEGFIPGHPDEIRAAGEKGSRE